MRLSCFRFGVSGILLAAVSLFAPPIRAGEHLLYIGTYTTGDSQSDGIQSATFDAQSGRLSSAVLAAKAENPSFLALHPDGKFIYAVNELGGSDGAVQSFAIRADNTLKSLNRQSSAGASPCHLVLDATGRNVLVANYSSGTVAVLPVAADGSLRPASTIVRHRGSGPNKQRQSGPHAHSINLSPDNRFTFAADLGADRVFVCRFEPNHGLLTRYKSADVAVEPGSGPRHLAWHPGGRFAYVNNELTATITVFGYAAASGQMKWLQTISTLPADFEGRRSTAEVVVHPSGRFVYCSNRGHDSIAVFGVDAKSGKLTVWQSWQSMGSRGGFVRPACR